MIKKKSNQISWEKIPEILLNETNWILGDKDIMNNSIFSKFSFTPLEQKLITKTFFAEMNNSDKKKKELVILNTELKDFTREIYCLENQTKELFLIKILNKK